MGILYNPIIFDNNDDNEVWKPLIYNGINNGEYLISNFGNIYDLVNMIYTNQFYDKDGYKIANLRKIGPVRVHRVVAYNFVSKKRDDQNIVNHINGIKDCNKSSNLEWCTVRENNRHAFDNGLNPILKLSDYQVEIICELLSEGKSYKEILNIMGIENNDNNRDMIGNIYRRIAWTHISSKYKFPEIDQRFRSNSKDTIIAICEAIEKGYSNKEVYEIVYGKQLKSSRDDKSKYELIRLIRMHKQFTDISSKYNF